MSKYVGWGALAKAFDKNDEKWVTEYKELSELLTPQEYAQARSTVMMRFTLARQLSTEFLKLSAILALTAATY